MAGKEGAGLPEAGYTLVLGTDYKGENKKAMLRQVMYWAKKEGNLGLHAASKIIAGIPRRQAQRLRFFTLRTERYRKNFSLLPFSLVEIP